MKLIVDCRVPCLSKDAAGWAFDQFKIYGLSKYGKFSSYLIKLVELLGVATTGAREVFAATDEYILLR